MKKIIKNSIVCILTVCFVATGSVVYAEKSYDADKGSWQQGKTERSEKISKELGLNEEQQAALKTHFDAKKEKLKELRTSLKSAREDLKSAREELKEELKKYNSDSKEIEKIITQMKKIQAKQIDYRVENFITMKQILTEEQFSKFSIHINKMKKRKKQKDERGKKS